MMTRISPQEHEWEALSTYLDEQLAPKERTHLEKRLKDNAVLRSELEDLRRTRSLLRDQPRVRTPRNFTLTPEMAGLRPGVCPLPGAYPLLRLASVLAAIFFVIVFVGDLATKTAQPAFQTVMTSEVELEMAPASPVGMGGGGGAETEAPAPPAEMPLAAAPGEPTMAAEEVVGENPPPTSEKYSMVVTPLGSPATPTPPESLEVADKVEKSPSGVPELKQSSERETPPIRTAKGLAAVVWGRYFLKVLQVLLAVLAVGAGLAAIYLRLSRRE